MRALVKDLPEITKRRLRKTLEATGGDIFVFRHSKRGWATVGLVATAVWIWLALVLAEDYRWNTEEKYWVLAVCVAAFPIGSLGLLYWVRWIRSEFQDLTLINPLYLLRLRFHEIGAHVLLQAKDFKSHHSVGSRGEYLHTTFKFVFEDGIETLKVKDAKVAQELLTALARFAEQVPAWFRQGESTSLYSADVLYEFRQQEKELSAAGPPAKVRNLRRVIAPAAGLLVGILVGSVFFYSVDRVNDYHDDERRWTSASSAGTAAAFRLYKAQRPNGRHAVDANVRLNILYQKAVSDYRDAAGLETSQGIEAVIKMLDYARRTGKYNVAVSFYGTNEIPADIERQLSSRYGVTHLIPIHPHFTSQANQERESEVVQRISSAFRQIIPADILQFTKSEAADGEIGFFVSYTIQASGALYYSVKEGQIPVGRRNWYTGITFGWTFQIVVPGEDSYPLEFSLTSEPANEIQFSYSAPSSGLPTQPPPNAVYKAMANSAFDDLTAKVLRELSVENQTSPPAGVTKERVRKPTPRV
jgi:hypothetical protein